MSNDDSNNNGVPPDDEGGEDAVKRKAKRRVVIRHDPSQSMRPRRPTVTRSKIEEEFQSSVARDPERTSAAAAAWNEIVRDKSRDGGGPEDLHPEPVERPARPAADAGYGLAGQVRAGLYDPPF